MGKSASGKDSIYKRLLMDKELQLKEVVSYTTRPIRTGERDGVEYYFVDEATLDRLLEEKKVIEHRSYHTIHGVWHYFTVNDTQIDLDAKDYIMIGTLESYKQIVEFYGEEIVKPIYIEVETGERLQRALNREKLPENQKYEELCRRFLADEQDFSEEKIAEAKITMRFQNEDFQHCMKEIKQFILKCRKWK